MERFQAAPGVLIAMPQLLDPNFHRSVILMVEHTDEGALGLVINHETEHLCSEVARTFNLDWHVGQHIHLRRGGPVERQSLWMVHGPTWSFDETQTIDDVFGISRSKAALERLFRANEPDLRLIIGYAGWGPGQLEQEVAEGSWLHCDVRSELMFDWPANEVWERSIRQLGLDPAQLVGSPSSLQ